MTFWHLGRMGIRGLAFPRFSTRTFTTLSPPFMEKSQQQVFVYYFSLKGWRVRKIQKELTDTLGPDVYSQAQISRWPARLSTGDISLFDEPRPGRRFSILRPPLAHFLERFTFGSARIVAMHFDISHSTIKEIFSRELGL
jgi:transposase